MSPLVKDLLQMAVWLIGAVGGVVAAFKAIREMHQRTEQSKRELRWSQSKQAKELIDELRADPLSLSALRMLDWSGRSYDVGGEKEVIRFSDLQEALRTSNLRFSKKERFIRDCFDSLLDRFGRFELYISNELIDFEDLDQYFSYYVKRMASFRSAIEAFVVAYEFDSASKFLSRFEPWGAERPAPPAATRAVNPRELVNATDE